jgi:hypothetical protein
MWVQLGGLNANDCNEIVWVTAVLFSAVFQNFTDDENVLVRFVEDVGAKGGRDADECHELVCVTPML